MENLRKGANPAPEAHIVRIIWAGHILPYITKNRSQAELHQHNVDTEEFEDCETDYDTENTMVLTGP